ncbi:MAG: TetR/AcrR family transcriptional regulator [Myxococcales bacterium]|nr:TetR/AcrR family transcriptional regulator [Myxococcales bacterium]
MGRRREFDEAEVVEKAMRAFWKDGWRDTTPQRLVTATGLSRSSLYATFGSKQGLFLAALDLYVEEQRLFLTQLLADGTLREGLERLYALMVDMMRPEGQGMTCMVARSLLEVPTEDAETLARVAQGQVRMREVFELRFQRAIDDGELDGTQTAAELARFIATVNDGIQIAARSKASADELRGITRMVVDTVC